MAKSGRADRPGRDRGKGASRRVGRVTVDKDRDKPIFKDEERDRAAATAHADKKRGSGKLHARSRTVDGLTAAEFRPIRTGIKSAAGSPSGDGEFLSPDEVRMLVDASA